MCPWKCFAISVVNNRICTAVKLGCPYESPKNAKVVIVENSQMAVTSTKFWNFFNLEKFLVQKFEDCEKQLLLFIRLLQFFECLLHFLGEKWACAVARYCCSDGAGKAG